MNERALDATLAEAGRLLAGAYGMAVTTRYNDDREAGGVFLRTHAADGDGANAEVGICASVITGQTRLRWESEARETGDQDGSVARALAGNPPGTITVYAYIAATSVTPGRLAALRELPDWLGSRRRGYHYGAARTAAAALARCLEFAPAGSLRTGLDRT